MKLFTVLDAESETHLKPFSMETHRDAIESFRFIVNEKTQDQDGNDVPKNTYGKFPSDFNLICIGEFDTASGKLTAFENPVTLINASKLVKENV